MRNKIPMCWNLFPRTLLLMGLTALSEVVCAQGVYNSSSIYLNGVSVYVDGDIRNDGLMVNDGYAGFTGDWLSRGKYRGTGIIEARGEGPQKISHFDQNMFSLTVNGWGTKYIEGKIKITGELDLEKGIVEVSSGDRLHLSEKALVSGGSQDSYVNGALTVEGNGYKYFPLGKSGTFAPIEFLDVQGEDAVYAVELFDDGALVSLSHVVVKSPLYWQRTDLAGKFEGSPVAVAYDPLIFQDTKTIVMLEGTDWDSPFRIVPGVHQAGKGDKLITETSITNPLVLCGEISDTWTGADFYLSTALSPDALRVENRSARIFGQRLSADGFHFTVFNRWGAVVFETLSLEQMTGNGWDGRTPNGQQLGAGAYPFKLTGIDKAGGKIEKSGVITILY
jgi:hypothetical protein